MLFHGICFHTLSSVLVTLYNTTLDLHVLFDAKIFLLVPFPALEESAGLEKFCYSIIAQIFHKDIKND